MNRRSSRIGTLSVGWLFADLLLALAMIFLFANTPSIPLQVQKPPTPTPTPIPTMVPTPTPTSQPPRLELQYHRITITIDSQGILNGSRDAQNDVETQIKSQSILVGRKVGLVIAYGGAPGGDTDIPTAQQIASNIYDILRTLGREKFAFTDASYYQPLYLLDGDADTVVIDIFLFKK